MHIIRRPLAGDRVGCIHRDNDAAGQWIEEQRVRRDRGAAAADHHMHRSLGRVDHLGIGRRRDRRQRLVRLRAADRMRALVMMLVPANDKVDAVLIEERDPFLADAEIGAVELVDRRDRDLVHHHDDPIDVVMHQVAISTVDQFNGADLGIRQEWVPLFDQYGVDLVVCGHEHHYERSHPIRGAQANQTLTPIPAATNTQVIDTTKGTVHMVIGGGGTSVPSNTLFFNPLACRVIVSVNAPDPVTGKRSPNYVHESAPWSAVRNAAHSYGFASFAVDPGTRRGGATTITVTYYD